MVKPTLIAPDNDAALAALREEMAKAGDVDAYIVPSEDPHMSEYPPDCCARRMYISGFTGSAGTVVITKDKALLWTDGRYYLQGEQQLTKAWTLMRAGSPGVPDIDTWLADELPEGAKVGVDPLVHTIKAARDLQTRLEAKGKSLVPIADNLVDKVWTGRPAWPCKPTRVHSLQHAGASVSDKLAALRRDLAAAGSDAMVLNDLAEIAWVFNMRGEDVDCNPVFVSYAIVSKNGAALYLHSEQVTPEVAAHLKEAAVEVKEYDAFIPDVEKLAAEGGKLWVDAGKTSFGVYAAITAASGSGPRGKKRGVDGSDKTASAVHEARSPVQEAKAIKNSAELAGMVEAHMRDAVALCDHFSWFEEQMEAGKRISEVELDEHLTACRAAQPGFVTCSFPTIAGCNGNGAIIHYRAQPGKCATIDKSCMLLVDSGGQYDCGTTDITRTFHFGTPTQHQKDCYTRVLQGHIALDTMVFPEGTPGHVLDVMARHALWQAGLDYRHGTGHGVGAALNVHEGPQSISFRFAITQPLMVDMIVSNEPGYYEDNAFGVRIENLVVIKEARTAFNFGGKTFMCFEPLTLVPIETKLMDTTLMSAKEVEWVNKYHALVLERVAPLLQGNERALAWLKKKCQPIGA